MRLLTLSLLCGLLLCGCAQTKVVYVSAGDTVQLAADSQAIVWGKDPTTGNSVKVPRTLAAGGFYRSTLATTQP